MPRSTEAARAEERRETEEGEKEGEGGAERRSPTRRSRASVRRSEDCCAWIMGGRGG
jgi:hypothetical protein